MTDNPSNTPIVPVLPRWLMPISIGGLAAYLAVLVWSERSGMAAASLALRSDLVAAVLGLSLLNYALRYRRWERYLHHLGHRPPRGRHVLVYLAGFALTVSPGKAGESVRALYLRRAGVPVAASLAALFVERVLDMLAVALLALLLGLAASGGGHGVLLLGGFGATLAVVALLTWRGLPRWLRGRGAAGRAGRAGILLRGTAQMLEGSRALLRVGLLLEGLALGVVAWAAEGYGLYLILDAMGAATITPLYAMGAYALSLIAGALSFLPGGVGGAEAALVALLAAAGLALPAAIAATALCRLATLWFAVVLGLGAMLALHSRRWGAVA